ncbi:hypothetical protein [Roseisolibacter sp. H3M3-2]|uniref:hypothetical protein n=1 Tax=Roseisolibacter sp. H3M3-2 TaxID=3031323 RepID=UPI0023DB87E8|nr:hypothetical protein [Roseisolibacter sp. H3M3-2]MDF1502109.1 hypothetical protein [Roseisolibacter sp. H3M3-2]
MTTTAPPPPAPPAAVAADEALPERPLDVPRDTTPTFELEMLVSGAVLFGLFQLIGQMEAWIAYWRPTTGVIGTSLVVGGGVLARAALYGLTATFVSHLVLRAYWVALVGVHSVFPHGPRWERTKKYGPMQAALLRERVRPLAGFIARADNLASIVFATGFVFAASVLTGVLLMAPFGILLWALMRVARLEVALAVAGGIVLLLALWQVGGSLLDYQRKDRLDPDSMLGRVARAGMRFAFATTPPGVRSLATVLSTNVRAGVVAVALVGGAVLLGAVSATRGIRDESMPGASNFPFFADAGAGALVSTRYASLDDERDDRAPWIDADVVTGPYLRVFIPYRPLVHDQALPAACPGLRAPGDVPDAEADRAGADVLACAARVHRLALDGRPLDSLRLRFLADPKANRRVFVAHVPVRDLAPGEHALTVWGVVRPGRPAPTKPYTIPFWK